MGKKTSYQKAHENIAALISELKVRKKWTDEEVGKLVGENGIKAESLRNNRNNGRLPSMRFCDVMKIAEMSGYNVEFIKRGTHG